MTNYPFRTLDPPWLPEEAEEGDLTFPIPDENTIVPVYYSESDRPVIDGDFDEWAGLDGPVTRLPVYGGAHDPQDAEAFFVLRTDGINLYIYSHATDDMPHENYLPGSLSWRGDTVEVFFGSNRSIHTEYLTGDNQIRLVGRSLTDPETDIVINQRTVGAYLLDNTPGALLDAWTSYSDDGYQIEASIPLSLLKINRLSLGQKIRCDFQINDADLTERDRLIHWFSPKDTGYFDPSVWGNGQVIELPKDRKGSSVEL